MALTGTKVKNSKATREDLEYIASMSAELINGDKRRPNNY